MIFDCFFCTPERHTAASDASAPGHGLVGYVTNHGTAVWGSQPRRRVEGGTCLAWTSLIRSRSGDGISPFPGLRAGGSSPAPPSRTRHGCDYGPVPPPGQTRTSTWSWSWHVACGLSRPHPLFDRVYNLIQDYYTVWESVLPPTAHRSARIVNNVYTSYEPVKWRLLINTASNISKSWTNIRPLQKNSTRLDSIKSLDRCLEQLVTHLKDTCANHDAAVDTLVHQLCQTGAKSAHTQRRWEGQCHDRAPPEKLAYHCELIWQRNVRDKSSRKAEGWFHLVPLLLLNFVVESGSTDILKAIIMYQSHPFKTAKCPHWQPSKPTDQEFLAAMPLLAVTGMIYQDYARSSLQPRLAPYTMVLLIVYSV